MADFFPLRIGSNRFSFSDELFFSTAGLHEAEVSIDFRQMIPVLDRCSSLVTEDLIHFFKGQVFSFGDHELNKCCSNKANSP